MIAIPPESIELWLRDFSSAVRDRDFDRGRELFDETVLSFGTVCVRAESLEDLIARQWSIIWPSTRGFEFDYGTARAVMGESQATVMVNWTSLGFTPEGTPFQRRGRATIVLIACEAGWKAVHTHFSMDPITADDSLLRKTA